MKVTYSDVWMFPEDVDWTRLEANIIRFVTDGWPDAIVEDVLPRMSVATIAVDADLVCAAEVQYQNLDSEVVTVSEAGFSLLGAVQAGTINLDLVACFRPEAVENLPHVICPLPGLEGAAFSLVAEKIALEAEKNVILAMVEVSPRLAVRLGYEDGTQDIESLAGTHLIGF